jgi:tetratricopeptide (TPR) repeat protein
MVAMPAAKLVTGANWNGPAGGAVAAPSAVRPPPVVASMRPAVKAPPAAPPKPAGLSPAAIRASILEMAAKLDKSTHFEILGIGQNANSDEVSAAFVRAARQFHPDRLAGVGLTDLQAQAERILARINEAVMVLQNSGRRAEYVASLNAVSAQAGQNLPTLLEAENLFLRGEIFLKKGDHARAIEVFTLASKGNPEEPQYRAYLAWARFDDPRARKEVLVRDTLKVLEGVLRERPTFARGHYWVGQLWKFLNEGGRAEHAFREAVRIDPAFIEASRELRLIEMRKSKPASKPKDSEPPRGGFMGKFWKR